MCIFSVLEASFIMGHTPEKIYNDIKKGKLNAIKRNNCWVISKTDLIDYNHHFINRPDAAIDMFEIYRVLVKGIKNSNSISLSNLHEKCRSYVHITETFSDDEYFLTCFNHVLWALHKIVRNTQLDMSIRKAGASWLEYFTIVNMEKQNNDWCGIEKPFDSEDLVEEIVSLTSSTDDLLLTLK